MEKKLLFITNIAGDKGVDSFSMASISAAHAIGYKFHVAANYARVTTEQKKKDENQYDVTIHHVDFHRNPLHLGNIKAYQQVCDLIEKEQITCIHCNTPIGGLIGRLAGRKCGVKRIIYQAHGFHFYKGAPLLNWLLYYPVERLLARCTDILITINHEDYEIAQKKFHLRNQGKVYYVPGVGIDLKAYEQVTAGSLRADVRQELGLDENATVCISMGDLIPRKNYSVAIEAMGRLCKKHPELHYLICGRGPELDNLKRLAVKNDIEGNVHFLGFRNDIKTLLQVSDFFLFASLQEGLPRSTMEAMASGLPLVCSRIRGNIDLIVEGQGGFMFEPKNVDDCVRAINGLLTSDHKKMGEYNLTRVREFSLEEAGERLTAIYQDEFYGNEGGGDRPK